MTTPQVAAILALEQKPVGKWNIPETMEFIRNAFSIIRQQQAELGALSDALETIAAQTSGVPGSTNRADCMAALARAALTQQTQGER